MAFVIADRVRETSTSIGTGSVTLAGAYASFQTFSAAIGNGNNTYYTIASATSGEWEVGIGTYSSGGNLLSRDTVLASSAGGAKVTFSLGTKDVFVTQPAERSLLLNAASNGLFAGAAAFTANGVPYADSTSTLATSSNLTFNGTTLTANALTTTSTVTINGGTANGVAYLNGSKVLTTGSALTYSGANFLINGAASGSALSGDASVAAIRDALTANVASYKVVGGSSQTQIELFGSSSTTGLWTSTNTPMLFAVNNAEQMRLTSSGLEIKQSQLIGYSSYAGIGTNGLAVAGNLGIGTSSPGSKLQVAGKITADAAVSGDVIANLVNSSVSGFGLRTVGGASGGGYALSVNNYTGSNLMLVDGSGNLGLGVTPSAWGAGQRALQTPAGAIWNFNNLNMTITQNAFSDGTEKYVNNGFASSYNQNSGRHIWSTAPSGTAGNAITFTQAMTLDASGNLVVGSTSAAGYRSRIVAASADADVVRWENSAGSVVGVLGVNTTNGTVSVNAVSNHALVLATNNTERARIDSSGNLGVGTSSPGSYGKFVVQCNGASQSAVNFVDTNTSGRVWLSGPGTGTGSALDFGFYDSTGAQLISLYTAGSSGKWAWYTNGSERARIDSSGNLLVGKTVTSNNGDGSQIYPAGTIGLGHPSGTGSGAAYALFGYDGTGIGSITQSGTTAVLYNVTSDERLKENIQDAAPASALIDALQVRQYDWKADGNHQRYGFIAQELVTVAPEAVHQPADPEEMMAVDYSKLVPMLVKEIQSLRQRVAQLEGK
jgi:hypothetical protein